MLTTLSQNPNLPPNRKQEIEQKRRALKDSVEMTLSLKQQKSTPLNTALSQINQEGQRLHNELLDEALSRDADTQSIQRVKALFTDCADNVLCDRR